MPHCIHCNEVLFGRNDKKYCDQYCKSAHQYQKRKQDSKLYYEIDRQLKINRKVLKTFNRKGLTTVRVTELEKEGFNPKYFTHAWRNHKNQVYLFCYEYGFLKLTGTKEGKYLLVQHQTYME